MLLKVIQLEEEQVLAGTGQADEAEVGVVGRQVSENAHRLGDLNRARHQRREKRTSNWFAVGKGVGPGEGDLRAETKVITIFTNSSSIVGTFLNAVDCTEATFFWEKVIQLKLPHYLEEGLVKLRLRLTC